MDHNELARRMGVTTTGSSSHSDKSRMHLAEGGRASKKTWGTNNVTPSTAKKMEGKSFRVFAEKTPRTQASIGGDMVNVGKRIAKGGAEFAAGKLKNASLEGLKRAKSGAESAVRKAKESLNLSHGGCAGRKKASVGGDIKNAAMEAKKGTEDFGRKAKAGLEGFGHKIKRSLGLSEGGEASMDMAAPKLITRKVTKSIKKGEMVGKPAKSVLKGSVASKAAKTF